MVIEFSTLKQERDALIKEHDRLVDLLKAYQKIFAEIEPHMRTMDHALRGCRRELEQYREKFGAL